MGFCVHCDQKEQCFTVSSGKQSTGVHWRVDVFRVCPFFYTLVEGFFRSYSGHQHNAGGHRSRGFCFSFLFISFSSPPPPPLLLASWVQAATGNSPDLQPESKQRAAGVVRWKTSSATPLISGDREGGGGGEAGGGGWRRSRSVCGCISNKALPVNVSQFFTKSECAHHVATSRIPASETAASLWWRKPLKLIDSVAN